MVAEAACYLTLRRGFAPGHYVQDGESFPHPEQRE